MAYQLGLVDTQMDLEQQENVSRIFSPLGGTKKGCCFPLKKKGDFWGPICSLFVV